MIVPVFIPHAGCGERCIYCNQGYITNIGDEGLKDEIRRALAPHKGKYEVGLFGGNIFGLQPDVLKKVFGYFHDYSDNITNFRISTKPLPLDIETLRILKENNVTVIELGIPVFNDQILLKLNRKHTVLDLEKAFHMLEGMGFRVALQVMVGLPDETFEDIRETTANIIRLKPHYIRIYPLAVLKDTPLHDLYNKGLFRPIPFERAVDRAMFIYLNTLHNNIKTVKMGLTDNEIIQKKVVAGCYHPAFGYMVKSRAYYLAVNVHIAALSTSGNVSIILNNKDIPHLLGYKRSNMIRLINEGTGITWTKGDVEEGCFQITQGDETITGSIFDALSKDQAETSP